MADPIELLTTSLIFKSNVLELAVNVNNSSTETYSALSVDCLCIRWAAEFSTTLAFSNSNIDLVTILLKSTLFSYKYIR